MKKSSNPQVKRSNLYFLPFLLLLVLLCYGLSLRNPLLWDDEVTVTGNLFIRDISHFGTVFSSGYHAGAGELTNLYRPLVTVSFIGDYFLWGMNPAGFHLTNVILHLLNVSLLFLILSRLPGLQGPTALITTLLFAIHPVNSEVVNYVSHRPELLMTFFGLASFFCYLDYRRREKNSFLFLALLFFAGSLLSKEMGVILPFFFFLYESFLSSGRRYKPLLPFLMVAAVYLLLRMSVLNFLEIPFWKGAQPEPFSDSIWIRLLTAAKIHWIYLRLFVFPVNLHMDHDVPVAVSSLEPLGLVSLIGILWLVALGWFFRGRNRLAAFGLFWYLGGLVPVSNFIPLNTAIAEHYLYVPSIGFFLVVATYLEKGDSALFSLKSQVKKGAVPFLIILLMSLTFLRTLEWGNEEKLYLSTINNTRYSFRANNNLGVYYFRQDRFDEAKKYFRRSLEIFPAYPQALNNLGVIEEREGDFQGAIAYYEKSVEAGPDYLLAHENLLKLYRGLGMEEERQKKLQEIRRLKERVGLPLDN